MRKCHVLDLRIVTKSFCNGFNELLTKQQNCYYGHWRNEPCLISVDSFSSFIKIKIREVIEYSGRKRK